MAILLQMRTLVVPLWLFSQEKYSDSSSFLKHALEELDRPLLLRVELELVQPCRSF